MTPIENKLLAKIAQDLGYSTVSQPDENPLSDPMQRNLVEGALKALERVAVQSLDYKLIAIAKLLQNWIKEKKA